MAEETGTKTVPQKQGIGFIIALIAVVLIAAGAYFFIFNPAGPQGLVALNTGDPKTGVENPAVANATVTNESTTINDLQNFDSDVLDPADFPVRQQFFKEVFTPRRGSYKIFEKTAAFLGKDIEGVKQYFGLNSEEEIYAALPKPAADFSEIVFLFAEGKYFTIGFLGEEYYKQPEFYPTFKTTGIRTWTKPDSKYWSPHGFGAYPSLQYDALSLSGRKESTGVVFVNASWGVQTYQGFSLHPDDESKKYFDITITPQNFLVGPAWPKFSENWAERVVVEAKLKDGTPPGTYKILINTFPTPKELKEQWEFLYKNIYFDASVSPVKPSGSLVEFLITVSE